MIAAIGSLALTLALATGADEPAGANPAPDPEPAPKIGTQALALPGQDPAEPFVPLHPRTAEDQARIEALDDYVSARALEDQRRNREAIDLLEQALEKDPDSLAVARRLARLCFSMGRIRQGVDYSRRVVKADPADAATLGQLIEHYRARRDGAALEGLLDAALADPKLDKGSPAALLARKALGDLYAEGRPPQLAKAADAYARVVEGSTSGPPPGSPPPTRSGSWARRPSPTSGSATSSSSPSASTWPSAPTAAAWPTTRTTPTCPASSPRPS